MRPVSSSEPNGAAKYQAPASLFLAIAQLHRYNRSQRELSVGDAETGVGGFTQQGEESHNLDC
jgi:hypothetical protein